MASQATVLRVSLTFIKATTSILLFHPSSVSFRISTYISSIWQYYGSLNAIVLPQHQLAGYRIPYAAPPCRDVIAHELAHQPHVRICHGILRRMRFVTPQAAFVGLKPQNRISIPNSSSGKRIVVKQCSSLMSTMLSPGHTAECFKLPAAYGMAGSTEPG